MSEMEQQPVCKIALGIEYDGAAILRLAAANEVRSVQEKLEICALAGGERTITVFAPAAPTPVSFMAPGQVVHFETRRSVKMPPWTLG